MRKLLLALFAMLLLMGSSAGLIAAQDEDEEDATPAASPAADEAPTDDEGDTSAGGAVDPAVGDTVPYIAENGSEVGQITVTEVVRPWEDYGEFEEPEVGNEFVAFMIEFENTSDGGIVIDDFDFGLQDAQGFFFGTSFVDGAEDIELAPLQEEAAVGGGETLEFLIVFEVFQGQELGHLFWQPDTGRLITLANLEGV